ncbi:hypothetical protein VHEMI04334 [[Torrubiella] hemipterigena]|uniref:CPAF-like PDZ domain-containing protein n=1 Tax=[Torrubiella] hemipterigena TaxID=1531966 RepID=A0A0A1T0Y1_9HYPO|nr:hypothetical protein VHEMI04334 [[Torrubiella] hemipterigena]
MKQAKHSLALALAGFITSASTSPTAPVPVPAPCALIRDAQVAGNKTVSAKLAYDCLTSVPLGKKQALDLVDSLEPYLEWQSDPTYLAHPPAWYEYPAYDLFEGLKTVRKNLVDNNYANEYAFHADLNLKVFLPAHDGHLAYFSDLLTNGTRFGRPEGLVSISLNGSSIPVIMLKDEAISQGNQARVITKINGLEAHTFLENEAAIGCGSQDADACYNEQFFQLAQAVAHTPLGNHARGGRSLLVYQGPNTTYTFADGTNHTVDNIATIVGDFTSVKDGKSFYDTFCTPAPPPQNNEAPGVAVHGAIPGYPTPVLMASDGVVAGFYLDGAGYEDVAVITLLSFESRSSYEFQAVVQSFLAKARADGKTKLIVDFQANGGGSIVLGYDFFKQLFPDIEPDGYSRWRLNGGFLGLARSLSSNPFAGQPWFRWQDDLNITNLPFTSFKDKFGPVAINNDAYTNIMRWDLNHTSLGLEVTGYGNRIDFVSPFKAQDIVLLYDGFCASTCTLASEMLRIQGGVKSIAVGGRPNTRGMQGVGGTKGSQALDIADIYSFTSSTDGINKGDRKEFARYTPLAMQRARGAGLNARDQILRGNVEDGLPAQFVYEEADCRLFWTQDMLTNMTSIWKAAASAAFHNGHCVEGGIVYHNATANTTAPGSSVNKAKYTIRPGTNILEGTFPNDDRTPEFLATYINKIIM